MHSNDEFQQTGGTRTATAWLLFLVLFFWLSGYLMCSVIKTDKADSRLRHEQRLSTEDEESDFTGVDWAGLRQDNPAALAVISGIYVDGIRSLSTKDASWTVDFYLWFKWNGSDYDPGADFQVINGEILAKEKIKESHADGQTYALYRVSAAISKFFNVTRYPLDDHLLTIRIEDKQRPWQQLAYVADTESSGYSSRVKVMGYHITDARVIEKPHAYKTQRGDIAGGAGQQPVYSQLVYGIWIERPDWGLYFKMFQGLFASVAVALLAFYFPPDSSDRINLGVGAFFASVASGYISMSELPGAGMRTLTDMVNGLGMVTILLTIGGSVIASRLARRRQSMQPARWLDKASLTFFVFGYGLVNTVIALAAAP